MKVWPSLVLAVLNALVIANAQAAQPYPQRPVRAIVGFAPGGATDILARALAPKLSDSLGQQVVIDNRAGGGGLIAATLAKEAPPDGYTLFFATISTLATNVATRRNLPYNPLTDYAPITMTAINPYFLVINPSVPARTTAEFIALAKQKPGAIAFGTSGAGGGAHLAVEMFGHMAGIQMTHVPYKGAAPAITDVLGGQIQMSFAQPQVMLGHAKAGRLRVLAVTSLKPLSSWPDAPPIAQTLPGYEASSWQGVVFPARTPRDIVMRMHGEIMKALRTPDLSARLAAEGSEIGGLTPDAFGAYIKSEIDKWTRVARAANIQPD